MWSPLWLKRDGVIRKNHHYDISSGGSHANPLYVRSDRGGRQTGGCQQQAVFRAFQELSSETMERQAQGSVGRRNYIMDTSSYRLMVK